MLTVLIKRNATSRIGEIPVKEIWNVKWDNISGGVYARQAGYSLYGYVDYDTITEMGLNSGAHAFYHNQNKVMIPASLNKNSPYLEGYKYLLEQAGPKPKSNYHDGKMPCTKRILKELENGEQKRSVLRDMLIKEGYREQQIRSAIKTMYLDGRITYETSIHHTKQVIRMVLSVKNKQP